MKIEQRPVILSSIQCAMVEKRPVRLEKNRGRGGDDWENLEVISKPRIRSESKASRLGAGQSRFQRDYQASDGVLK